MTQILPVESQRERRDCKQGWIRSHQSCLSLSLSSSCSQTHATAGLKQNIQAGSATTLRLEPSARKCKRGKGEALPHGGYLHDIPSQESPLCSVYFAKHRRMSRNHFAQFFFSFVFLTGRWRKCRHGATDGTSALAEEMCL